MNGIIPFEAVQMSPLPAKCALKVPKKCRDHIRNLCFVWQGDQNVKMVLTRVNRAASQMLILDGAHGCANEDLVKIDGDECSLTGDEYEMKAEATERLHGQLHVSSEEIQTVVLFLVHIPAKT